ncbi:oligopeptide ABC transporter substrate-binding protein OppA [Endozoicomonas sp. OPT23]|uniref:peptide ABC transporter substrate-binding protein n=1 Tax=Endozoicomonas sp. OPT23 TaxID=2072845 RepID=UPI00129B2850|nr:peptide ABC transporter substrate-binding protein [Endozoicomonas sp. OPT23]MRI31475.1 oligopeptide ABC transporter substrate-binding protein OppA [Endozoicomonas sp. OPT23]
MTSLTPTVIGLCALILSLNLQAADLPNGIHLADNQTIKRTLHGDPESLDPHLAIGIPEDHVIRELFEGLVTQDLQGNIIPGQAESWQASTDGKVWTFNIRKGLKWSDGKALNAHDFVYSFRRLANPETASPYAWYLASMSIKNANSITKGITPPSELGIRAQSDHQLVLELSQPTPYLLPMLTHRSVKPVPRHATERHGKNWVMANNIVVNGPFILSKRVIREFLTLDRNNNYWNNNKTVLTQVTFLPIESETAALLRYKANEVDIVSGIPASHYKSLANKVPDQLKSTPTLSTYYLTFNTRKPPLNNKKVRKALAFAINREKIASSILGLGQKPAYTFTPPTVTGFIPPIPDYQAMSDSERIYLARELLEDAGYNKKSPLKLTYLYNNTGINRLIAIAVQEMWQKHLPVVLTLESQEWATYLQNKLSGNYQIARALWGGDYDDAMTMLDNHTPEHANNSSFYNSPAYNQLLNEAGVTLDRKQRNQLYVKAELILANDMPIAPVFWNSNNYLIKPDIRGVSYTNPEGRIYSKDIYRVK